MAEIAIRIVGLSQLTKAFAKSPTRTKKRLQSAIRTSVNIIRPMMVTESPIKSGKLHRNIYAIVKGLRGEVGVDLTVTPYAWFVHEGTKPYIIRPKTKKALYWPGAKHPVKMVRHPGIKANPFVDRTAEKMEKPVEQIFQGAVDGIIRDKVND